MRWRILFLPGLSCLWPAAHALRTGNTVLCLAWLGLAGGVIGVRRWWMRWVGLVAVGGGLLLMGSVTLQLVQLRWLMQAPWERLALIMSAVCGHMLVSFAFLLSLQAKLWYSRLERH